MPGKASYRSTARKSPSANSTENTCWDPSGPRVPSSLHSGAGPLVGMSSPGPRDRTAGAPSAPVSPEAVAVPAPAQRQTASVTERTAVTRRHAFDPLRPAIMNRPPSSQAIRPSRTSTTRSARAAISGLWVTITIVLPAE